MEVVVECTGGGCGFAGKKVFVVVVIDTPIVRVIKAS
uniref:Uncharacterized protein n=1 Tax=Anguilla anguilla TaxID=7936 RepID=A0A0E9PZM3_ANGAN